MILKAVWSYCFVELGCWRVQCFQWSWRSMVILVTNAFSWKSVACLYTSIFSFFRREGSFCSAGSTSQNSQHQKTPAAEEAPRTFFSRSQSTTSVAGKASDQPKRTPVTQDEIESILLGGCIWLHYIQREDTVHDFALMSTFSCLCFNCCVTCWNQWLQPMFLTSDC